MDSRAAPAIALALALLAPAPAAAGDETALTLQAWIGVSRYDVGGLQAGIAAQGEDLLQSPANAVGGSAVLRLGALDLGVLYEAQRSGGETNAFVLTPVVGFAWRLGERLRLDLLGELGGHRVANVTFDGGADLSTAEATWLPYLGVRPTVVVRWPIGGPHLVVSAAPFARWDLVRKTVDVTAGGGSAAVASYELGGVTFGLTVGAGLEF